MTPSADMTLWASWSLLARAKRYRHDSFPSGCSVTFVLTSVGRRIWEGRDDVQQGRSERVLGGMHIGTVVYSQVHNGRTETLQIDLEHLAPNRPYWVANYFNLRCLPSPGPTSSGTPSFGIIVTDASGGATFARSVAIRRGDNSNDLDEDGVIGWKDEINSWVHPQLGLIGCDGSPVHS